MAIGSHSSKLVTIFGGSGFVGTQVVQLLARQGYRMRVAVRRPDLAGHVRLLGAVGQVQPIQANVRNAESVRRAVAQADMVINLAGIGSEWGQQNFLAVNAQGAGAVAEAAKAAGVPHLVHVSALGASSQSASAYSRSKARGEAAVLAAFPEAAILRPSIVFGKGDSFFNLIGFVARTFPVVPVIGKARFQPAYVGDVAEAIVAAGTGAVAGGRIYELGGPEIETYKDLAQRVLSLSGRTNPLLPLAPGLARLIAWPMGLLPNPLLTGDQVTRLGEDNVVSPAAIAENRTFAAFGIVPTAMDAILPSYLWRFRRNGQFDSQTA